MKQAPEEYAENLISEMFSYITTTEPISISLISAKFCAKQSVKENIRLLRFINTNESINLIEYFKTVLEIIDKRNFIQL